MNFLTLAKDTITSTVTSTEQLNNASYESLLLLLNVDRKFHTRARNVPDISRLEVNYAYHLKASILKRLCEIGQEVGVSGHQATLVNYAKKVLPTCHSYTEIVNSLEALSKSVGTARVYALLSDLRANQISSASFHKDALFFESQLRQFGAPSKKPETVREMFFRKITNAKDLERFNEQFEAIVKAPTKHKSLAIEYIGPNSSKTNYRLLENHSDKIESTRKLNQTISDQSLALKKAAEELMAAETAYAELESKSHSIEEQLNSELNSRQREVKNLLEDVKDFESNTNALELSQERLLQENRKLQKSEIEQQEIIIRLQAELEANAVKRYELLDSIETLQDEIRAKSIRVVDALKLNKSLDTVNVKLTQDLASEQAAALNLVEQIEQLQATVSANERIHKELVTSLNLKIEAYDLVARDHQDSLNEIEILKKQLKSSKALLTQFSTHAAEGRVPHAHLIAKANDVVEEIQGDTKPSDEVASNSSATKALSKKKKR